MKNEKKLLILKAFEIWKQGMISSIPNPKKPKNKLEKRIFQIYAMGAIDALTQQFYIDVNESEDLIREIRKKHLIFNDEKNKFDLNDKNNEFESNIFVHGDLSNNEMMLLTYAGLNQLIAFLCSEKQYNNPEIQSALLLCFGKHITTLRTKGVSDFWSEIRSDLNYNNNLHRRLVTQKQWASEANKALNSNSSGCLFPMIILISSIATLLF